MTENELVAAALVSVDKFGISDEARLFSLLPSAIVKFQSKHIWDFLIAPPTTFATVANQDYVVGPNNLFKVVGIWKTDYVIRRMSRKQWTRFRAYGTLTETQGQFYAAFGRKIYLAPRPTSAQTYNLLYYPMNSNLSLGQIPEAYHFYIQKILETMCVPKATLPDVPNPYPAFRAEEEAAFRDASAIDAEEGDETLKVELSDTNRLINTNKRGMRRSNRTFGLPGFAVNR